MKVLRAQPNPAHISIASLARYVPKLTVITQNVDDLHERAGSAVCYTCMAVCIARAALIAAKRTACRVVFLRSLRPGAE